MSLKTPFITFADNKKSSEKSSEKILSLLKEHPEYSAKQLSSIIRITDRGVEKQLKKLQEAGKLKRIGPAKGGHWAVLE